MQTRKTLSHREVLHSGIVAMGAVGIGGLIGSRGVRAAETIKAGYMSSVTDNDKSWGQSQLEVLGRVSREFQPGGASVEFIRSFGVPPPDYAEQAEKLYSLGVRTIFVLDEGRGPELYRAGVKRSDLYIAESGTGLDDTTPPGTTELPKNMVVMDTGLGFAQQHYVFGVLAGKMTKVNKVGFIGGEPFPSVVRKGYAFVAGVKDANPDADVSQYVWAGKWGDPDLGRKLVAQQIAYGVDIMLQYANGTGLGVMQGCKAVNLPVFGANWAGLIDEFPEICIGASNAGAEGYAGTDEIYKRIISAVADGTFEQTFGGQVIRVPLDGGPLGAWPRPELNPAWISKIPGDAMAAYDMALNSILDGSLTLDKFNDKLAQAKMLVEG